MCGILAQINRDALVDTVVFDRMRDTMTHRGPDGFGTTVLQEGRVAFGHRRLSIIDLSIDGKQPMSNEDGQVWITFNGEIYNFQPLREQLIRAGHIFRSRTDTEVLIHGYEEWGMEGLLQRLKGMFAFVIWDGRKNRILAARDRFGIKPLVYSYDGKQLVFASEIKAIAANPSFDRTISEEGLADFFTYSYVPYDLTIYKNAHKLPPAHYLTVDLDSFRIESKAYWNLETASLEIDPQEAAARTNELIREATREHLIADVPVGLFLSGGYDSGTLLMHMHDLGHKANAYTIGFEDSAQSEHDQASTMASLFGADHIVEMISPQTDVFSLLQRMSYYYDEPFAASSMVNTFMISEMAARHCKVVLSGEGADEVFAGYKWHRKINQYYRDFSIKDRIRNLREGLFSSKDVYLRLYDRSMTGVLREALQGNVLHAETTAIMKDRGLWHFGQFYKPGMDVVKQCQLIDSFTFIPNHCLWRADISSMAHSLEVRVPFMDHEIYAYVFSLQSSVYFQENRKKFLIEENLKARVPESILQMPKRGFSFQHLDHIFDDRFYELLANGELMKRGLLKRNTDLRSLSGHFKLHLLNLEIWFQTHMQA
jgi:asparagine synthase (glutamine-hydrolysing)